jgi:hypothetical protein
MYMLAGSTSSEVEGWTCDREGLQGSSRRPRRRNRVGNRRVDSSSVEVDDMTTAEVGGDCRKGWYLEWVVESLRQVLPKSKSFIELDGGRAPWLISKIELQRQFLCGKIGEMGFGGR